MPRTLSLGIVLVLGALHGLQSPPQTVYTFDSSHSSIEINVFKEGLFSAFGHNHLIAANDFSGTVQFDPDKVENSSVALRVASKSLTVIDPGVSANDRQQVQATMLGPQVLDAARYPEISFHSTRVTQVKQQGSGWTVTLTGMLQLHGAQQQVTFPLTVSITGGELVAEGDTFILQTDFGIAPIRIAGGAVKVKDRLRLHFNIRAHQQR
jgi:polyisoprenoid-binding protein YceI